MHSYAQQAATTLKYYMRMIAREAGIRWESDNDSEVDLIVDRIMDAVTDEIKQAMKETNDKIKGLSDQIAELEKRIAAQEDYEEGPSETIRRNADAKRWTR